MQVSICQRVPSLPRTDPEVHSSYRDPLRVPTVDGPNPAPPEKPWKPEDLWVFTLGNRIIPGFLNGGVNGSRNRPQYPQKGYAPLIKSVGNHGSQGV